MINGRFIESKPVNLAAYVGLIPATSSTGEKEKVLGIRKRHNNFLRPLLIEAAWVAVKKDPALTLCYNKLINRMKKQEAIIRIAKKLLSRTNYVLKNNKPYVKAVVKINLVGYNSQGFL